MLTKSNNQLQLVFSIKFSPHITFQWKNYRNESHKTNLYNSRERTSNNLKGFLKIIISWSNINSFQFIIFVEILRCYMPFICYRKRNSNKTDGFSSSHHSRKVNHSFFKYYVTINTFFKTIEFVLKCRSFIHVFVIERKDEEVDAYQYK
jgi:hypothetical protein